MKTRSRLGAALAVALLLAACGSDDTTEPDPAGSAEDGGVTISEAWSRMSPMRASVAAAYLVVDNDSDQDDALLGATVASDVAGVVELHETYEVEDAGDAEDGGDMHGGGSMDDDMDDETGDDMAAPMMSMREIDALPIPAGGSVELQPGGYHLMLLELTEDLVVGDTYELTLSFEHAGEITVTVEVREQP